MHFLFEKKPFLDPRKMRVAELIEMGYSMAFRSTVAQLLGFFWRKNDAKNKSEISRLRQ